MQNEELFSIFQDNDIESSDFLTDTPSLDITVPRTSTPLQEIEPPYRDETHSNNDLICHISNKCEICNINFVHKGALTTHMLKHNNKLFACRRFEGKFYSMAQLKEHINAQHEGNYYQCNMCSKKFQTKHGLKMHVRGHNGLFKFQCDMCIKGFNYLSEFDAHVNRHHNLCP